MCAPLDEKWLRDVSGSEFLLAGQKSDDDPHTTPCSGKPKVNQNVIDGNPPPIGGVYGELSVESHFR